MKIKNLLTIFNKENIAPEDLGYKKLGTKYEKWKPEFIQSKLKNKEILPDELKELFKEDNKFFKRIVKETARDSNLEFNTKDPSNLFSIILSVEKELKKKKKE
jgi:hypothetical protein